MLLRIKAFFTAVILFFSCIGITGTLQKSEMKLSNPDASPEAKELYRYICEISSEYVLSGQQEGFSSPGKNDENDYIFEASGKYPAIRGFDFIDDDFDGVCERAEEWHNKGGIVTICWHSGKNFDEGYEECLNDTVKNWNSILKDGTKENAEFIKNMDNAGNALKKLQEKEIPVLWRPFHEFNGKWFWWGKGGADNFKRLWKMMYNHFVNDLGLDNLIWVLGYSQNHVSLFDFCNWYPGDEYCDIVGADSYNVGDYGAEKSLYDKCMKVTRGKKPLFMHECGTIPTEEQFEKAPWCGFVTWHSEYLINTNSKESLNKTYNSQRVITLDELDFRK